MTTAWPAPAVSPEYRLLARLGRDGLLVLLHQLVTDAPALWYTSTARDWDNDKIITTILDLLPEEEITCVATDV